MNSGAVKNLMIGFWLVAVSVIGGVLLFEDRFFAVSGVPMAKVGMTSNSVTYRSEEDTRWKFLSDSGQLVFDGDRIATGRASSATIDFGDGRIANIGQDTTVSLSAIRQQNGMTYIISLPSGVVGVENRKSVERKNQAQFPIIVRSGGRDFYIEPNEEKAILNGQKGPTEIKGKRVARAVLESAKKTLPLNARSRVGAAPAGPSSKGAVISSIEQFIAAGGSAASPSPSPSSKQSASQSVGSDVTSESEENFGGRDAQIAAISPILLQSIAQDLAITIPDPPAVASDLSLSGSSPVSVVSDSNTPSGGLNPSSGDASLGLSDSTSLNPKKAPSSNSAGKVESLDMKSAKNNAQLAKANGSKLAALSKTSISDKPNKDLSSAKPQLPTKPQPPPPPPVAGTEIGLVTSAITAIYYSFKPLSQVKGSLGDLGWKNPANIPAGWQPILELTNGGKKKQITDLKGSQLSLNLEDFGPLTANSTMDGLACADLGVRGGAKISDVSGQRVSISKQEFQIKVCSYRDSFKNVPLAVGLSTMDGAASNWPLMFPRPPANDLKFQMIVDSPRLYLALMPLIERSPNLRVGKVASFSQSGIFIAKAGKVIMQLAGSGFTAKTADRMLKLTGGDFIYRGPKDALYDASSYSADELKDWVSKSVADGRKVYVHRAGNLLPISKDFLEERKEVAAFVKTVSTQLFTQKVDIIAFR